MSVGEMSQAPNIQQAQHIWQMLDDLSQNDPEAYRRFIDHQMAERKKFLEPPAPHMCMRILMNESSSRHKEAYVNVFSWQQVPEPKNEESPIPILGGPLEHEADIRGGAVLAAVAFNPSVLKLFGRDAECPEEREMLVRLALNYLRDQHQLALGEDYSILPASQLYVGDVAHLRKALMWHRYGNKDSGRGMGVDPAEDLDSVLEELGLPADSPLLAQLGHLVNSNQPTQEDNSRLPPHISINKPSHSSQERNLHIKPSNTSARLIEEVKKPSGGRSITPQYELKGTSPTDSELRLKVVLPGLTSVTQCELDISAGDVELQVEDSYRLHIKLPCQIKEHTATAKFSRRSSTLTVTLPKT